MKEINKTTAKEFLDSIFNEEKIDETLTNEFFDNVIDEPELHAVTDWSDYYFIFEKELPNEINLNTGIRTRNVVIYYYKLTTPFPGDGYFLTSDPNIKEETEQEYLDRNVFKKYDSSVNVKIINMKEYDGEEIFF